MPDGSLIDRLPSKTIAWGRCYTVVAAGLDSADSAFEGTSDESDDLLELEALGSARITNARLRLGADPAGRPRGPFSAVVLDALSIHVMRSNLTDEPFGGWVCFLDKEAALDAARARWHTFFSSSGATELEVALQIYSARIGGRFISRDDFARHLAGSRSANDPEAVADEISLLWQAGADGILLPADDGTEQGAIVLRGSSVSRVRAVGSLCASWDGKETTITEDDNDFASEDVDALPLAYGFDFGATGSV